jgi:Trk K+ transport system NAD-binding subunit
MGDSPIANQSLRRSRPWDQGVIILSIKSDGKDLPGIPSADTTLSIGDVVTVYGEEHHIRALFETSKHVLD